MLKHILRAFALATIAVAFPVAAHHVATPAAIPTSPGPNAVAISVQGQVQEIVLTSHIDGTSRRIPVFIANDGSRYALNTTAAAGLLPGDVITLTGMADGRTVFPESVDFVAGPAAAAPVGATTLNGVLRLGHADNFDGTPSEFFFAVVTDDGQHVRVALATLVAGLENGMRVTVTGTMLAGDEIAPTDIVILTPPAAASLIGPITSASPVTTNYLVLPIKFPTSGSGTAGDPFVYGADPFTPASLDTSVFGALPTKSAKEFYKEASFGLQLLGGATANDGSGGFLKATVAKPATCDINVIANAAASAARARGYPIDASGNPMAPYTGLLYVFNNVSGCGWSGLAYVGWARAYSNNTSALWVIGHELGHNFGLLHAGSLRCSGAVLGCGTSASVAEYGDPFSSMGNSSNTGHFNAMQKDLLGWTTAAQRKNHASGTATYTLNPIETGGQTTYGVRIPTANSSRTYWLEYRQPVGTFDQFVKNFPNLGAQVRLQSPFEKTSGSDDTELLDMTPATGTFNDAALLTGQNYTDAIYGVSISVLSATASALTVQVTTPGTGTATITQTTSVTPANYGAPVKFTATVTASGLTGPVNFTENGGAIAGCTPVTVSGGPSTYTASCTTSSLLPGTHSIVAVYAGDSSHAAVSSTALSQVINKAASTSAVASSLNPAPPATNVTFTATVTGAAPTGTFDFKDGATNICSAVALAAGSGNVRTATCTTSALTAGTHSITAVFAGDALNSGSTSPALSQSIGLAGSTTGVASALNPAMVGQSVTFTATVSASAPTGNVNFKDGATSITGCAAVALTGSGNIRTAACTTSALTSGTHSVTAVYAGDVNNSGSTSPPLSQDVALFGSTTTLASSLNPSLTGQTVTFTASVTGTGPTGTVAFKDGASTLSGCGAVPLTGAGNTRTAACATSALAQGTHPMTASYSGDAMNATSVSASLAQVVATAGPPNSPVLQGASMRRTHGVAGTFDLALSLATTSPTTEPRMGPAHTLVLTFDKPITGATVTVTEGAATAAAPSFGGNEVLIALSNVSNQQYVTVTVSGVSSADGGTGGAGTARIGFLAGDTSQDRVVTIADVALINAALAQPITAANFLRDIDASGAITVGDKAFANGQLAKGLPLP
jgi:hypothetical protein